MLLETLKKTFIPFFIGAFTTQDNAAEVDVIFFFTLASLNFLIYVPNQYVFVIEKIKIIYLHFAKKIVFLSFLMYCSAQSCVLPVSFPVDSLLPY